MKNKQQVGQLQSIIVNKLNDSLSPLYLTIHNDNPESYDSSRVSKIRFSIVIVSENFSDQSNTVRQHHVQHVLQEEISQGYGITLHIYTPKEWQAHIEQVLQLPQSA